MSKEILLQLDMFNGELVDTRTQRQKRTDDAVQEIYQVAMFPQREIAQFGVSAKPLISLTPSTKLALISEDPRTPEEREQDLQREAEEKTYQIFDSDADPNDGAKASSAASNNTPVV
jgi:hypothetical protein